MAFELIPVWRALRADKFFFSVRETCRHTPHDDRASGKCRKNDRPVPMCIQEAPVLEFEYHKCLERRLFFPFLFQMDLTTVPMDEGLMVLQRLDGSEVSERVGVGCSSWKRKLKAGHAAKGQWLASNTFL